MDPALIELLEKYKGDFETLASGRLRCVLTGHELLPQKAALETYLCNKKFQDAKLEKSLSQFKPHIVQHPESRDKLVCKLTGAILNRSEEAVWKHMMGRKFQRCLEEVELAKKEGRAPKTADQKQSCGAAMDSNGKKGKKGGSKKAQCQPTKVTENGEGAGKASGEDSEESDFWVPPEGERWDHDGGEDRWGESTGQHAGRRKGKKGKMGRKGVEDANGDVGMGSDGDNRMAGSSSESDESEEEEAPARTKRPANSIGPYGNAPQKKKKKRQISNV